MRATLGLFLFEKRSRRPVIEAAQKLQERRVMLVMIPLAQVLTTREGKNRLSHATMRPLFPGTKDSVIGLKEIGLGFRRLGIAVMFISRLIL